MNVRIAGTGPRILFVHGWNHSGEIWQLIQENLKDDYETVAIDLPGFGASPPLHPSKITLDIYAQILTTTATTLSQQRPLCGIIADSLGAILALMRSEDLGQIVDQFLLSGCPAGGIPHKLRPLGVMGVISNSLRLLQLTPMAFSSRAAQIMALGTVHRLKNVHPTLVRALLDADPRTAEILFRQLCKLKKLAAHRFPPEAHSVILRGEHDWVSTKEQALALANRLGGRYVEIPDAAHTPMIENVARYSAIIQELLSGIENNKTRSIDCDC